LERARAALAPEDEAEVYAALLRLLREYRVDEPPRLFPEGAARGSLDFACSSMVLSQLAIPLTNYVEQRFAARFPTGQRAQSHEFRVALGQFAHRVQQAHVRALLAAAPCVALTSDTVEQYTGLDPRGGLLSGKPLPLLGAPRLDGLVPQQLASSLLTTEWQWRHVVPTRSKPHGRTVQVAGVVAMRA
jgi:hypothetical protein